MHHRNTSPATTPRTTITPRSRALLRALAVCALPCVAGLVPAAQAQAQAQAPESVKVLSVTAGRDDTRVAVRYRCEPMSEIDTLRVGVTDSRTGAVYGGTASATCDNKSHRTTVSVQRLGGPAVKRGHRCVVSASLGSASFGMFEPGTRSSVTERVR